MKTLVLIWATAQVILIVAGWALIFLDKKYGKTRRLGNIFCAIGNLMMAASIIYLLITR